MKSKLFSIPLLILLCFGLPAIANDVSEQFDLIIRNARIVDGSGNPWFKGDIGIKQDRIAVIGRSVSNKAVQTIDAGGLIVCPGFIDMHSHSDWLLLEDGDAQSKIRQGVTTEVIGEGASAGPFKGKLPARAVTIKNKETRISTLGSYFDALEQSGVSVNVASYVGQGNIWRCVMGDSFDEPSEKQLSEMKQLVIEAMKDGAQGLSCQLMMPPGLLATTEQLVELCQVVRSFNGIFSTHIRNEGLGVFEAVKQAIEVGERSGVPVDIIHLKIADQKYWGRMNEVIALIDDARSRGVNVQSNVYPYTRGNNNLSSIIPPWAHEGGTSKMLDRLKSKTDRVRLKRDILNGIPGWYNHYTAVGGDWSRMLISDDNQYKGMTMDIILAERTKDMNPKPDMLDELFDLLIEENGSLSTVYAHHTEADMNLALRQPWCSIGSDGSAYAAEGPLRRGNPHPRNFGTFPRVLGRYVREQGLLTLEDAIRKMTSLNAAKIALKNRGFLKEGYFADITIFDPAVIIDQATYTDPFHYNKGIIYVIVNGKIVLDHDRHTGARPGRALRHM